MAKCKAFWSRVVFIAVWLGFSLPALAEVQEFSTARMTLLTHNGATEDRQVRLPYSWDQLQGQVAGQARFSLEIDVSDARESLAIFIPRIGNLFEIKVNGWDIYHTPIADQQRTDPSVNEPIFVVIPIGLVSTKTTVEVVITALVGKQAGLGNIYWGPATEVRPLFEQRYFLEVKSRQILGVITAVLGLFGLLMWIRLRELAFLYYGLSEILWTVLTIRTLIDPALLPWPWAPFFLYKLPLLLAPPMLYKALLSLLGADSGKLSRSMNWTMLAAPVFALMTVYELAPLARIAFSMWQLVFVFILAWISFSRARVKSRWEHSALALLLVALSLCGLRDVLVYQFSDDAYLSTSWLRFAWIAIGISFVWITVERLHKADAALATMNANLSDQLAARNSELQAAWERERDAEKERGAIEERQRLMRDLHDGLGSQLHGALRMAQMPQASKSDVATQLIEAIDQMKITVDAMQETEGDIPAMLGAVRYRLAPRLTAAGITLLWDVQRLPKMESWTVKQAYQLQMLLLEAFTNMMVHSGASTGSLSAHLEQGEQGPHIAIRVTDNGKGFDALAHGFNGKGMASMRTRATALGAMLTVTSEPSNTCVLLCLPVAIS